MQGNNSEAVILRINSFPHDLQIITGYIPCKRVTVEINSASPLFAYLNDFYDEFAAVFKSENFKCPTTGLYCSERAHNRAYNNFPNGPDLFSYKDKAIAFISENTFYDREESLKPLDTFQIKYFDEQIFLIFERQTTNLLFFSSHGVYATKRFESACFFPLLLGLVENIININNNDLKYTKKLL